MSMTEVSSKLNRAITAPLFPEEPQTPVLILDNWISEILLIKLCLTNRHMYRPTMPFSVSHTYFSSGNAFLVAYSRIMRH